MNKVVKLLGGLGNQMFQYAFYAALSDRFGSSVKADITGFDNYPLHNGFELARIFDVPVRYSTRWENFVLGGGEDLLSRQLRNRFGLKPTTYYEQESAAVYDASIMNDRSSRYYLGYWQNERYFSPISGRIKELFLFKKPLSGGNEEIGRKMASTDAVSIHVRRGDYVNHPLHGGVCGPDYYRKALERIKEVCRHPVFFVFSDDIGWCVDNLDIGGECSYVDWNKGDQSCLDMHLMSLSRHSIIANSSFSWWGAWLKRRTDGVTIAPANWFARAEANARAFDIIPGGWIRI